MSTSPDPSFPADAALGQESTAWLSEQAEPLDASPATFDLLGKLAAEGLTRIGIPSEFGGDGGTWADTVEAISDVARHSLTASFVLWSHRTYTECVVRGNNPALRERELPDLLTGKWAGAVGMSNAMKFVCGLEPLEIIATLLNQPAEGGKRWNIQGQLPWVTNLQAHGFSVVAAAQPATPGPVPVFSFRSDRPGVRRSEDLPLIGLCGSSVAAVHLDAVQMGPEDRLHENLTAWLPQVRPQFLGFQCGMSIGLARASIDAARQCAGRRQVLVSRLADLNQALESDAKALRDGLQSGRFSSDPTALFRLRIALAGHVQESLSLELQSWGGRAYLTDQAPGFERRWRESAFIPVITPSLAQLEAQLNMLKSQAMV